MHAMHSARIPRSVGCLQASLWRSLVLQYTRDHDLRWTNTAYSTEVWCCYPRVNPCGCLRITTALVRRCASSSLSRNDPFAVFSVVET
jgi:hypothetical protein